MLQIHSIEVDSDCLEAGGRHCSDEVEYDQEIGRLSILDLSPSSHPFFLCIKRCDIQVLQFVQMARVDLAQNLRSRLRASRD